LRKNVRESELCEKLQGFQVFAAHFKGTGTGERLRQSTIELQNTQLMHGASFVNNHLSGINAF
jgi:hypothetical protein